MTALELSGSGLTFSARHIERDWYEFDVSFGPQSYKSIGGQAVSQFLDSLVGALTNEAGRPLSVESRYVEHVGTSSRYLGFFYLSPGYTTFYFFRQPDQNYHVVMANAKGDMLNHAKVSASEVRTWVKHLSDFSSGRKEHDA